MQQLDERPAPAGGATSTTDPLSTHAARPEPRRRRFARWWLVGGLVLLLLLGGVALSRGAASQPASTTPVAPTVVPFDARGRIVPVSQARVTTLQGGILRSLRATPGLVVAERDEVARIETAAGTTEVLFAPFAGTILVAPAQVGDGLLPGSQVVLIGDLSALRAETTDVDEYQIASLRVGQTVEIHVDALGGGGPLSGRIGSVTLAPQAGQGGDLHYPVSVTLDRLDPGLRPGMTARLRFRR